MSKIYLIDGSGYIFRAYYAMPPLSSTKGLPTNAVYGFTLMLMKLIKEHKPEYLGIAFDTKEPTFRHRIFKDYKGHRPAPPEDLVPQFAMIHSLVDAFKIKKLLMPGVEADDLIGTAARIGKEAGMPVVIVTADKDFMQLVDDDVLLLDEMRALKNGTELFIDAKGVEEKFGVPPNRVIDVMALSGDTSDNIPGVRGIGPKTAIELVKQYGELENVLNSAPLIKQTARREKLIEDAELARISKKLVTIDRNVDYPMTVEDFAYRGVDRNRLLEMFTDLNFKRLLTDPILSNPDERFGLGASKAELRVEDERQRIVVEGEAELKSVVANIKRSSKIAVCVDVDSKQAMRANLLGISVSYKENESVYISAKFASTYLDDVPVVAHDAKFAQTALLRAGFGLCKIAGDPMIARYLLREDFVRGASKDADPLLNLTNTLEKQLQEKDLEKLYREIELPLETVLAKMERAGVKIDSAHLQRMSVQFADQLKALEHQAHAMAGEAFNLASPKQVAFILFEKLGLKGVRKTKTGQSTDANVLEELANQHPLAKILLEHRSVSKLKGTYVDVLPGLVNQETGRLHTTFNQAVAATGRLSSSDPNLQNIPIRGVEGRRIREAFVAEQGFVLVSLDYSQVELRILAHMSDDPVMTAAFQNAEDIHQRTASEIFGVSFENVTKEHRNVAKTINFGLIYGMGPIRLSKTLGISRQDATTYIARYYERYKGVYAWQQELLKQAKSNQEVRTLFGRLRTLPDIVSQNRNLVQQAERMAINTPIQGTAADLIKVAMVDLDASLAREFPKSRMILQVHDELLIEAPKEEAERVMELAKNHMIQAISLKVPIVVECGIGSSWGTAH